MEDQGGGTGCKGFVLNMLSLRFLLDIQVKMLERQRKTDTTCFHSYVDLEKLNRRPWGRGREKKSYREGES